MVRGNSGALFSDAANVQLMRNTDPATFVLSDDEITVRPACAADEGQLYTWFHDPEIYRWWGGEPKTREYVVRHLGAMKDDDGTAWPFIVLHKNKTIGYLQVWRDNNGDAGLDMFLAPAFRGRGLAARAARAMALCLSDAGWARLTVDPALHNERAVRMWEKAGFEKTGTVIDIGDGPSHLMVFRQGLRGNTHAMDLTKDYPRSPREELGGMMILPRAIDKARAQLEGKLGQYIYFGCHVNRMLFHTLGVTEDEFLQTVRSSPDDEGVLEWIQEFVRPESAKIEAMNRRLLNDGPQKPEEQKHFKDELDRIDPGNDHIKTWPDLIDLEEGRLPKESATATVKKEDPHGAGLLVSGGDVPTI